MKISDQRQLALFWCICNHFEYIRCHTKHIHLQWSITVLRMYLPVSNLGPKNVSGIKLQKIKNSSEHT